MLCVACLKQNYKQPSKKRIFLSLFQSLICEEGERRKKIEIYRDK